MPARLVNIADLQPTDTIRPETSTYLESLTDEEIDKLCQIENLEVIHTAEGLLISDGNQRIAEYARRGRKQILTELKTTTDSYLAVIGLSFIKERAKTLRRAGIFSPQDLYKNW